MYIKHIDREFVHLTLTPDDRVLISAAMEASSMFSEVNAYADGNYVLRFNSAQSGYISGNNRMVKGRYDALLARLGEHGINAETLHAFTRQCTSNPDAKPRDMLPGLLVIDQLITSGKCESEAIASMVEQMAQMSA